ncbi:hypothetical protein SprV_0200719400 [Sparganum proliferum]
MVSRLIQQSSIQHTWWSLTCVPQMDPQPADDEEMHALLVRPPDEDIVLQMLVSRPRVYPGGLLPRRKAEEGVGRDEPVFCSGSQEEQAIVIKAAGTMGTQNSPPDIMVCANAGVEVTKGNQLSPLRHRRQEGVWVLVEFVPCLLGAGYWWGVVADDGGEFASPKVQAETIADGLL